MGVRRDRGSNAAHGRGFLVNESWIWGSTKSSSKRREKPAGSVLVAQILMIRPELGLKRELPRCRSTKKDCFPEREERGSVVLNC